MEIIKNDEAADKNLKSELDQLVGGINIKEKTESFGAIDQFFEKLNSLPEEQKNLALQHALGKSSLTIDGSKKKLSSLAKLFDKAVDQENGTWKIRLKEGVSLRESSTSDVVNPETSNSWAQDTTETSGGSDSTSKNYVEIASANNPKAVASKTPAGAGEKADEAVQAVDGTQEANTGAGEKADEAVQAVDGTQEANTGASKAPAGANGEKPTNYVEIASANDPEAMASKTPAGAGEKKDEAAQTTPATEEEPDDADLEGLSAEEQELVSSLLNEKNSPLAYLIQKSSNFAKIQAQKGYGADADTLLEIREDKILWNQTRRALSGLLDWIGSDLSSVEFASLTPESVLSMGFISQDMKEKIEASGPESVKSLWNDEAYERKSPYTNNFALKKKENADSDQQVVDGKADDSSLTPEDASVDTTKEHLETNANHPYELGRRFIDGIHHEVVRLPSFEQLPKDKDGEYKRPASPKKIYRVDVPGKAFHCFDNGKCQDLKTEEMADTKDVVANVAKLQEQLPTKKANLIKAFELQEMDGGYYTREGDASLYTIDEVGTLYAAGPHWVQKFLWGKADHWEVAKVEDLPSREFLKTATIRTLGLQQTDENCYGKEWWSGAFAFDKQGKLCYAGIDRGRMVFEGLDALGHSTQEPAKDAVKDSLQMLYSPLWVPQPVENQVQIPFKPQVTTPQEPWAAWDSADLEKPWKEVAELPEEVKYIEV